MHCIEHRFGSRDLIAIALKYTQQHSAAGPYRSIESVAGFLGCSTTASSGHTVINVSLASALFMTALSGRFMGGGGNVDVQLVSPSARVARLMEELGPQCGRFDMSDEEVWEIVDGVAKRLWGRTCVAEVEADIDGMAAAYEWMSKDWLVESGLDKVWLDFVSLRRKLLAEVKTSGPASLSPRSFPEQWLDRLCPWYVVANPGGETEEGEGAVVFGRKFEQPAGYEAFVPPSVAWGRLHEPQHHVANAISVENRAGWLEMLERFGPLALLMLNGRRHRLMIPPALERPIDEIASLGVPVRFDPDFEWPGNRDAATWTAEALELAHWSGRSSFHCDITGDEIPSSEAALLTPWEFRRSALLPRFHKDSGGVPFSPNSD
jgi:hypothetical protein